MRSNRRRDTGPELRVRRLLHSRGWRYRVDHKISTGVLVVRPDIVFEKRRVAVFIDGCYWHCCPDHGTSPRVNSAYWSDKLARNVERDERVSRALEEAGWTVIRVWEHVPASEAVERIESALRV